MKRTYEDCISVQRNVIERNREKLRQAEKKYNYDEMRRLRYILNVLYDEKNELELLWTELKEYA